MIINPYLSGLRALGLDEYLGMIIAGQSNAVGLTTPAVPTATYAGVIEGAAIRTTGNTFKTLKYPTNNKGSDFGCELTLCYDLFAAWGRPVFIEKVAVSGAAVYDDFPNQNYNIHSASTIYPELRDGILALKTRIRLYGKTPKIILIWIQGERDTQNSTVANAWNANFEEIYTQLIIDGAAADYVMMNLLNPDQTAAGTPTERATVRAGQLQFINNHTNGFALDMAGRALQADNLHYTGPAQEQIGHDIATIVFNQIYPGGQQAINGYSVKATRAIKQYNTSMPEAYRTAIATFIDGLQTDGNLAKIRTLQIHALDTPYNALIDAMGYVNAVNEGTTHSPKNGITGNGSSTYINHRFDPSLDGGALFVQNNNFFGWYVKDNMQTTAAALGGLSLSAVRSSLIQQNTQLAYYLNTTTAGVYTPEDFFADNSLYLALRTASTGAGAMVLNKNGTNLGTDTDTSSALQGGPLFGLGENSGGVLASPINAQIGLFIAGAESGLDKTALNTRVQQLFTDLAAI